MGKAVCARWLVGGTGQISAETVAHQRGVGGGGKGQVASWDRSHGRACPSPGGDTGGPVRRANPAPTVREVNVPGSRVADIRVTSPGGVWCPSS